MQDLFTKLVRRLIIATIPVLLLAALAAPAATAAEAAKKDATEVVNVNTATASQLALLPRVGPALAGRIIEFRDENGKFEKTADLILVRGIGEKTFKLMEPFVVTTGETTLTTKVRVSSLSADKAAG